MTLRGLMIAAPIFAKLGSKLWKTKGVSTNNKKKKKRKLLAPEVDFGVYMKEWRFKQLKLLLPKTMEDGTKKEIDAWWQVQKFSDS